MANNKNKANLNAAVNAIQANRPRLQRKINFTLEQLTGTDFWDSLTSGQRKGLGIQFKAYAKDPAAIVVWIGSTSTHTQLYQLI